MVSDSDRDRDEMLELEKADIRVENQELQERMESLVSDFNLVCLSCSQTLFRPMPSFDQNRLRTIGSNT